MKKEKPAMAFVSAFFFFLISFNLPTSSSITGERDERWGTANDGAPRVFLHLLLGFCVKFGVLSSRDRHCRYVLGFRQTKVRSQLRRYTMRMKWILFFKLTGFNSLVSIIVTSVVGESGLFTPTDGAYLQESGVKAILVVESIVKQKDPTTRIAQLFGKDISA